MEAYVIPDIYCPFPAHISPHFEEVRRHALEWAKDLRLIQKEMTQQHYLAENLIEWTCRIHPKADLQALFVISEWHTWGAIYDDLLDNTEGGTQLEFPHAITERLLDLLRLPHPTPRGAIEEGLFDVWQRLGGLTSPLWRERFTQHHASYFAGQRWDAENRASQRIPNKQAYIINRRNGAAVRACFDLIEFARYIDIPTEIYESKPFQDILQASEHIVSWTNDVYSLKKELTHHEVNNLVVVVQHERNCSLQEAVNEVCAMVDVETWHFHELVQYFMTSSTEANSDLCHYLTDVGCWIRGNRDWSRNALRYAEGEVSAFNRSIEELVHGKIKRSGKDSFA